MELADHYDNYHDNNNKTTLNINDTHEKLIIAKVVAMIVLGVASFSIGIIPIKLSKFMNVRKQDEEKNLLLSLLLCFGGGVLLFTTFLHLQPEVRQSFQMLEQNNKIPTMGNGISISDLVFCAGFFFVYLIEELVHMCLDKKMEHEVLHRSLSLRCPKKDLSIPRVSLSKSEEINVSCITNSNQGLLNSQAAINVTLAKHTHHKGTHSHTHVDESMKNSFRGLLAVLALSFHAVFEGLAVGLENGVAKVWYLFGAIATHKLVIAFCVGVELVSSKTKMALVLIYLGTFAVVTPLGIGIGIALSESGKSSEDVTSTVLQGMAAGTLLYVVFFEVLARERGNRHNGIWQLFAILAGFAVMFTLQIAIGHEHSHGHGRVHSHGQDEGDAALTNHSHDHDHIH